MMIIVTLCLISLPGFVISKRIKTSDDYALGGRNAGALLVAGSIANTIVGGAATVGTAQGGFTNGLVAWWFTLGSGIALIIMAIFYAKPLRLSGLTTISEYLVINYGSAAGPMASLSASLGIYFSLVASSLTAVHLIGILLGTSFLSSAVVIIVIVAGLVILGGQGSNAVVGLLKFFLVVLTIFVGGFWAVGEVGGVNEMILAFEDASRFSLLGKDIEASVASLLSMIIGVISTQSYVQALYSAKDARAAARGCALAAVAVIPVGIPSILIGMNVKLMHPEVQSIDALPYFMINSLPHWLGGIGLAVLIISAVGSIAGLSLGIGTMISRDIFGGVLRINNSRALLNINRIVVLLVTALALVFVYYHLDSSVLQWNYLSMALRGAGVFLPLTMVIFCKQWLLPRAGLMAMAAGIAVACSWRFLFPTGGNALFPSLLANAIFLFPSICYTYYRITYGNK